MIGVGAVLSEPGLFPFRQPRVVFDETDNVRILQAAVRAAYAERAIGLALDRTGLL